jgi:hypothetical protein
MSTPAATAGCGGTTSELQGGRIMSLNAWGNCTGASTGACGWGCNNNPNLLYSGSDPGSIGAGADIIVSTKLGFTAKYNVTLASGTPWCVANNSEVVAGGSCDNPPAGYAFGNQASISNDQGYTACAYCLDNFCETNLINNITPCCLGLLTSTLGDIPVCAPGWCKTTRSSACDIPMAEYYTNGDLDNLIVELPPDLRLLNFCSVPESTYNPPSSPGANDDSITPGTIARWEQQPNPHWCYDYTSQYCSNNPTDFFGLNATDCSNGVASQDPACFCAAAIDPDREYQAKATPTTPGTHPLWADTAAGNFCNFVLPTLSQEDQVLYQNSCQCIVYESPDSTEGGTNIPNALSCAEGACVAGGSYVTNAILSAGGCSTICQTILSFNANGGNVNIENSTFDQNCTKPGFDFTTYYSCESGKCTPTNNGIYTTPECGGSTQCAAPATMTYVCSGSPGYACSGPVPAVKGSTPLTQDECNQQCVAPPPPPPAAPKYSCTSNGCQVSSTGTFGSAEECTSSCTKNVSIWDKYKTIFISIIVIIAVIIFIALIAMWVKDYMAGKKKQSKHKNSTHPSPKTVSSVKHNTGNKMKKIKQ